MRNSFDLPLMTRDSLADWRAQLHRRFPRAPETALDLLSLLFLPFALRFALEMRKFNGRVGKIGLGPASLELLKRYYAGVALSSDLEVELLRRRLSEGGPTLVLANHPGVVDTLALFHGLEAAFGVKDFMVVANDRDFFNAMPAIRERIIPVPSDPALRAAVFAAIEDALKGGRSVVLYPSGDITADPCLAPEIYPYDDLLGTWSPSVGLLIARARKRIETGQSPPLTVLPVLCGGVLPKGSADAWWMGRNRSRREREAMAVGGILAFKTTRRRTIRLRAGMPLNVRDDLAGLSPKELGKEIYRAAAETAVRLSQEFRKAR